jgi:hypothetical protein
LEKEIEKQSSLKLLQTGSCGLHTLHNGFQAGCSASGWDIEEFLSCLYTLFNDATARRDDFVEVTGCHSLPLKFCKHRGVGLV